MTDIKDSEPVDRPVPVEFSLQAIRTVSRNQTGQKIIKLNMFRTSADQTEAAESLIPTGPLPLPLPLPLPPPLTEELNVIVLENETLIFTAQSVKR